MMLETAVVKKTTAETRIIMRRNSPAFAVFVDEECAAQHESEEARQRSEFDRQRRDRDERTFKERSDEGMVRLIS